jgi:CTP synthase
MRLGNYSCRIEPDSAAGRAYGAPEVEERHRHRYEFNNRYREELAGKGLRPTGIHEDHDLVEIVENPGHPWFVGVQFHPEFNSRPTAPHPLFRDFVRAARARADSQEELT